MDGQVVKNHHLTCSLSIALAMSCFYQSLAEENKVRCWLMAQATTATCLKVIQTVMHYLYGEDKKDDSNLICFPYKIKTFTVTW